MEQIINKILKENQYNIECEVITPLFMGNATQQPELREQSINGILRWYFRIAGGSKETENNIFGSTSNKSSKGLVKLKIIPINILKLDYQRFENTLRSKTGYQYLGFSLKMNKREAIDINSKFNLIISFNPYINQDYKKKFFGALWLAFNLGNFGARSRRAFGAIKINSITHNNQKINEIFGINFIQNFSNQNQIKQYYYENIYKIKEFFKNEQKINNIPNLFDNFYIYLFNHSSNDYLGLLDKIGEDYKNFRKKIEIQSRTIFGLPLKGVTFEKRRSSLLNFKPIKNNNNYHLLIIKMISNNKNKFIFHPNFEFKEGYYNNLINFANNNVLKIYEPA
jgi:CRISPR-associated protein Cmr1